MRLCSCGGKLNEGELTTGRTRWECRECGRYEIFRRVEEAEPGKQDLELPDEGEKQC